MLMNKNVEWNVGLYGYKKCTLELGDESNRFTTELLDVPTDTNRSIAEIFNDHLSIRQSKYVEVLYSGGIDSELVLLSCLKNNIPVIAMTLVIKVDGMIINAHDLYYAEKFCREHDITHKLVELNANHFFDGGVYFDYMSPYHIIEPQVATHLWLIEQCSHFPIIGGDWPWVHAHLTDKVLSPFRLEFASYERYMADKGIMGIGNMISYSLDSSHKMIKLQMDNYKEGDTLSILKSKMYRQLYPELEPRVKSHGWEKHKTPSFDLLPHKLKLWSSLKNCTHFIKWNTATSELLGTKLSENNRFH